MPARRYVSIVPELCSEAVRKCLPRFSSSVKLLAKQKIWEEFPSTLKAAEEAVSNLTRSLDGLELEETNATSATPSSADHPTIATLCGMKSKPADGG